MTRLMLLSNSTNFGGGYLDHAMPAIRDYLGALDRILFVPFALYDREGYTEHARRRFAREGIEVRGLAPEKAGRPDVDAADAIFLGGGNTFRLLDTLQRTGLLEAIRARVRAGAAYLGSSAGTNVATPTIKTTNDMPIVQPASFDALGLVPFQINPHYLDPDAGLCHMGETRDERIREFHEENTAPVVAIREGAWLRVENGAVRLEGARGGRIFRRGEEPIEIATGDELSARLG